MVISTLGEPAHLVRAEVPILFFLGQPELKLNGGPPVVLYF